MFIYVKKGLLASTITSDLRPKILKKHIKIQRFLRSLRGTGTWTKCWSRHKTGTDRNRLILYRHRKVFILTFIRPVWAGHLEFSAGLVPEPALCPGAGAAERPQEILYVLLYGPLEGCIRFF
jgi:hypothetical protein